MQQNRETKNSNLASFLPKTSKMNANPEQDKAPGGGFEPPRPREATS
jgi:hypothetical protein